MISCSFPCSFFLFFPTLLHFLITDFLSKTVFHFFSTFRFFFKLSLKFVALFVNLFAVFQNSASFPTFFALYFICFPVLSSFLQIVCLFKLFSSFSKFLALLKTFCSFSKLFYISFLCFLLFLFFSNIFRFLLSFLPHFSTLLQFSQVFHSFFRIFLHFIQLFSIFFQVFCNFALFSIFFLLFL